MDIVSDKVQITGENDTYEFEGEFSENGLKTEIRFSFKDDEKEGLTLVGDIEIDDSLEVDD